MLSPNPLLLLQNATITIAVPSGIGTVNPLTGNQIFVANTLTLKAQLYEDRSPKALQAGTDTKSRRLRGHLTDPKTFPVSLADRTELVGSCVLTTAPGVTVSGRFQFDNTVAPRHAIAGLTNQLVTIAGDFWSI
jgi:hypothetical protein